MEVKHQIRSETTPLNVNAPTEMPTLSEKRVFITGGSTGIGLAIATLLASEGARIFTCGRDQSALDEALASIRAAGGTADGATADLARADEIERIFTLSDEALGGLDILIKAGDAARRRHRRGDALRAHPAGAMRCGLAPGPPAPTTDLAE